MSVKDLIVLIGELAALAASIAPIISKIKKISEGTKCQLRSEMLRTYYHNKESGKIRQFEYENFVYCYDAYNALKGNSFIEKINDEVKQWEIVT